MTRHRIVRAAAAFVMGVFLFAGASAAASATDDDVDEQGNLSVTVTDGSTPTPTPSGAVAGVGVGAGGGTGSGGSAGGSGTTGATGGSGGTGGSSGGGAVPGTTATGILSVGGLTTSPRISIDPFAGTVRLWFTVRNDSKSVVDGAARFWMTTWLFGIPLDEQTVTVGALQPGESRVVSAELEGAGQWALVDTHVTLTPPETIDGAETAPVTRDALVFVVPWLILAGTGVALAGLLAARLWQRFRGTSAVAGEAA